MFFFDHHSETLFVIDFSASAETNIVQNEDDKRSKYPVYELRRLHLNNSIKEFC